MDITISGEYPNERASCWAGYYISDNTLTFQFALNSENENITFKKILNQIKSECTFFRVEYDEVYCSCPKSKYKGKIGFHITEENAFLATWIFD